MLLTDREAKVGARVAAVRALPALRGEERHDVVAGRDGRDAVADALDDARAFVSEHGRRIAGRVGAGRRVQVGMTDAAGDEADENLAGLGLGQIDLLHHERLTKLFEYRGSDLHAVGGPTRFRRPRTLVAEFARVDAAVELLQALDLVDVRARVGELDPLVLR